MTNTKKDDATSRRREKMAAKEKEFDLRIPVRTATAAGMQTLLRVSQSAKKPTKALKHLMKSRNSNPNR